MVKKSFVVQQELLLHGLLQFLLQLVGITTRRIRCFKSLFFVMEDVGGGEGSDCELFLARTCQFLCAA